MKMLLCLLMLALLSSCAQPQQLSPCPNFGRYCDQMPVNGWYEGG